MDLTGKIAIITGCSSGVGLATTELFLSIGARVFGLDRSPCSLAHPSFQYQACDLASVQSIKEAVEVYRTTYGSELHVLANVAGIMDAFGSADSVTDDVWDRTLSINLTGPTQLIREVVPLFRNAGRGSIINVGSKASTSGGVAGVAYTASKHALVGVTKNVAWRFRNDGIRCNAVCPGNGHRKGDVMSHYCHIRYPKTLNLSSKEGIGKRRLIRFSCAVSFDSGARPASRK
ncbi:hypothetical protein NLU13_3572 [Sarocladium strictum]|uniref:Uncharacterized protein n=1 Tax=Sarocladium strictum TaxID=5046 RepID=A0AA39GN20_SARSR|nr:hypothetical protein NLU13_3572 [Sarocladium strictum]